ncbi:MAG: hypothetical protein WAW80_02870 [Candidatus Saccharimonadales bacterium]
MKVIFTLATIEAMTGAFIETPLDAEEVCVRALERLMQLGIQPDAVSSRYGIHAQQGYGVVDIALNINELNTMAGIKLWAMLVNAIERN